MHQVLKAFDYAHDGLTVEHLPVGTVREFRPELVEHLEADGFIGDVDAPAAVVVDAPAAGPAGASVDHIEAAASEPEDGLAPAE